MKKALAFVLLLGTAVGVPASASAAPAVTVEFPDGVLWDDCFQVPINLSIVGDNPPAVRYQATVTLRDPEGFREEFASELGLELEKVTVSGSVPPGGVASLKTAQAEICGFESPGTWRANVKVEFFDGADASVATLTATDTATFRQRLTETTLSRRSRGFVVHIDAEVPGGGFAPCRKCFTRVQRASGNKWKPVAKGFTNAGGDLRTGYKPRKGQFRAITPGFGFTSINAPSESPVIRVR